MTEVDDPTMEPLNTRRLIYDHSEAPLSGPHLYDFVYWLTFLEEDWCMDLEVDRYERLCGQLVGN